MTAVNTLFNAVLMLGSVVLIIIFTIQMRRRTRQQDDVLRRYFEQEDEANSVRKKSIAPELFYAADFGVLPALPEGDPFQVERCANRKMIRFSQPVTNLELKQQFGPAQMEIIAQYEENFNEYLKALTNWAKSLAESGREDDALTVLEEAITLGSEYRSTYKLAADIYAGRGDTGGLQNILSKAETNYFRDPVVRRHILEYIEGM